MYRKIECLRKIIVFIWDINLIPIYIKSTIISQISRCCVFIYRYYLHRYDYSSFKKYYQEFCDFYLKVLCELPDIYDDTNTSDILTACYANGGIYLYYRTKNTLGDSMICDFTITDNGILTMIYYNDKLKWEKYYDNNMISEEWDNIIFSKALRRRMILFVDWYMKHNIM